MNPRIPTVMLAFATVMMMKPQAAQAAPYWPWCSRYFPSEIRSCAFVSRDQCMETIRGIGGFCYMNPVTNPYTPLSGRPVKSGRRTVTLPDDPRL